MDTSYSTGYNKGEKYQENLLNHVTNLTEQISLL